MRPHHQVWTYNFMKLNVLLVLAIITLWLIIYPHLVGSKPQHVGTYFLNVAPLYVWTLSCILRFNMSKRRVWNNHLLNIRCFVPFHRTSSYYSRSPFSSILHGENATSIVHGYSNGLNIGDGRTLLNDTNCQFIFKQDRNVSNGELIMVLAKECVAANS